MSNGRIFTKEQTEAMGQRTLDILQSSIDAGETKKAGQLSQRMYNEFLGMHDLYRDWITDLLTFIGRRYGDKVLYEALEKTVGNSLLSLGKRYANKSAKLRIEMLIAGLRGHLQLFKVEEDDEKVTISALPCGSGGRLILEGAYNSPKDFLKVQKAQPMTFDRQDFPVYCSHCYFQNILPIEPGGESLCITKPANKLGQEPCHIYIYK